MPTICDDEYINPSARLDIPVHRSKTSSGTVDTSWSYSIEEPSLNDTVLASRSTPTASALYTCRSLGSRPATPFQIAPVPGERSAERVSE